MSVARPGRVLVTTDLTSSALVAVPYAVALARRHGAVLDVVHVVMEYTDVGAPYPEAPVVSTHVEEIVAHAEEALEALELGDVEGVDVRRHVVRSASIAKGVADTADDVGADIVVIASHGRRLLAQVLLGSVARNVVATATRPVLCVKSSEHGLMDPDTGDLRMRRLLVPTDLSEESARALGVARDLATVHDGAIELLHVAHVEIPPMYYASGVDSVFELDRGLRARLEQRLDAFAMEHDARSPGVTTHVLEGAASRAIAARADEMDADLIVLTKHGRGATPHLLGGVPERLLHDAHCPILLV